MKLYTERDGNNSVCGIFLHFGKAFDTVNHNILSDNLEYCDVKGNALNLI